jgi:hypothetical protein
MDVFTCEISGAATKPENERKEQHEKDLRPEYCRYKDEGCEYAPACLDCPFPQCLYDAPRGRQRWLKELRNREIARLYKEGRKAAELSEIFEVSLRTVQRALKVKKGWQVL